MPDLDLNNYLYGEKLALSRIGGFGAATFAPTAVLANNPLNRIKASSNLQMTPTEPGSHVHGKTILTHPEPQVKQSCDLPIDLCHPIALNTISGNRVHIWHSRDRVILIRVFMNRPLLN